MRAMVPALPFCDDTVGSDIAVIKSFVRKLNESTQGRPGQDCRATHQSGYHDKEFHLANFLNVGSLPYLHSFFVNFPGIYPLRTHNTNLSDHQIIQPYNIAFPKMEIAIVSSSLKWTGYTAVAIVFEHNHQDQHKTTDGVEAVPRSAPQQQCT